MVGDFLFPGGYAGRLLMQCVGIVFVAFGVFLYLDVDLVPMPMEGMTMAIAENVKKPLSPVVQKICFGTEKAN